MTRGLPLHALWVSAAFAAAGCKTPYKEQVTTRGADVAALPELELGGPAARFAPVAQPGERPRQLDGPEHRRMHREGYLWVGWVRSRLDAWHVAGALRKLGITHWHPEVQTQTTSRTQTYCTEIAYDSYGFVRCSIGSDTATKVEHKTSAVGVVGQLFMPRAAISPGQQPAVEAAWADHLVLEAVRGRAPLDLAFELGATANATIGGVHWLDFVCRGDTVDEVASWNVAALLSRGAQLTPARAACLASKFHHDPLLVAAIVAAGGDGRAATRAAVAANDCLTAAVLVDLGAGGAACDDGDGSASARERLIGLLGVGLLESQQPLLPLVQALGRRVRLSAGAGRTPPLVMLALARGRRAQREPAWARAEPTAALIGALLTAGADPNAPASLSLLAPGAQGVQLNPLEAAILVGDAEVESLLRKAGGAVLQSRLQAAQAAWAAAPR